MHNNMEQVIEMYLNYVNKFITVDKFAEWYGLDVEDAHTIIEMGRKYNEIKYEIRHGKN
jgi:hypothetical protein